MAAGQVFNGLALLFGIILLYKQRDYLSFPEETKGYCIAYGIFVLSTLPAALFSGDLSKGMHEFLQMWFWRYAVFLIILFCIRRRDYLVNMLTVFTAVFGIDCLVTLVQVLFDLSDNGNIYSRLGNPTEDVFEQRIAALEGGIGALALASGAAAITYAFQGLAQAGDHIVAAKTIYGGTYNLLANTLPEFGITTDFVDPDEKGAFEQAIKENTKAIFIESIGNPNASLIDIKEVADIAHKHKIPLVVDSTFATPYLLRPIEFGADIVVHSATKFIGGHGTALGGVIVDSGNFDWEKSGKFPSLTEPNPSYHGISFTKVAGKAAFITKLRAVLLRD